MSALKENTCVKKRIQEFIDKEKQQNNLRRAAMNGVIADLRKLKPIIEDLYDDEIFYLDYWETDCVYHGWDWSEDDGTMKSMSYICDQISEKFEEIYALILIGLGEEKEVK